MVSDDNPSSNHDHIVVNGYYINEIKVESGSTLTFNESCFNKKTGNKSKNTSRQMPKELNTPHAREIWEVAKKEEWVDDNLMPKLSNTQTALLAYRMYEVLKLPCKWATLESFWNREGMCKQFEIALGQKQSLLFQDELKNKIR